MWQKCGAKKGKGPQNLVVPWWRRGESNPRPKKPQRRFLRAQPQIRIPLSPSPLWPGLGQGSFIKSHRLQSLFRLVACIMTPLTLYAGLEATTCRLKRRQLRDYRSDLFFVCPVDTRCRTAAARLQRHKLPRRNQYAPLCVRDVSGFAIIPYAQPEKRTFYFRRRQLLPMDQRWSIGMTK